MATKHRFNCLVADDGPSAAAGQVVPSNWNDSHKCDTINAIIASDGTGLLVEKTYAQARALLDGAMSFSAIKTANYTLLSTDNLVSGDSSGGAFTLQLLNPASVKGQLFAIRKVDSSFKKITLARFGAEKLFGKTANSSLDTQDETVYF